MGGAREFFCAVRDAAQRIRDAPLKVEQMEQEAIMRSRRDGPRGKGGVTDPSRRIDDMIDYENRLAKEQAEDRLLVTRGEMVVDGLRQIDPLGADVLFERYLNLSPWPIVAFSVGLTLTHTRERESLAFDRIDSEGIAAMGIGEPWATVADGGAYRVE